MPPQTFPLRPRWGALIGAMLLFGGAALFFAWRASSNERGLIINGLIELGVTGATWFYTVLAFLSLAMTGMGLLGTIRVLGGSQQVIVEDDAMTIPGALFQRPRRIAYRDITALELQQIAGEELLRVRHRDGHHAIAASLVGPGPFRVIVELVRGRVSAP